MNHCCLKIKREWRTSIDERAKEQAFSASASLTFWARKFWSGGGVQLCALQDAQQHPWPLLTICHQHTTTKLWQKTKYPQILTTIPWGTKITMGQELLQTEPSYLAFSPKLPRENLLHIYTINSFVLEVFSSFKMNTF